MDDVWWDLYFVSLQSSVLKMSIVRFFHVGFFAGCRVLQVSCKFLEFRKIDLQKTLHWDNLNFDITSLILFWVNYLMLLGLFEKCSQQILFQDVRDIIAASRQDRCIELVVSRDVESSRRGVNMGRSETTRWGPGESDHLRPGIVLSHVVTKLSD